MNRNILLASVVILGSLGVWYFRGNVKATQNSVPVLTLSSEKVIKGDIEERKLFSGTLKAENTLNITLDKPAKIKKIKKDGEFVKTGDVVVEFENTAELSALSSAEAVMLEQESQYNRAINLRQKGLISEADLQSKKSSFKKAEADYQRAKFELDKMTLKAPFDGFLGLVQEKEGAILSYNQKAAVLVASGPLSVMFSVSEKEAGKIKEGDEIDVFADSPSALPVTALIVAHESQADSVHRVNVKAKLVKEDKKLIPGQFVRVSYTIGTKKDVLLVSEAAVRTRSGSSYVFVVEGDTAILTPVNIGVRSRGKIEIIEGLKVGQIVVVETGDHLSDGTRVKAQLIDQDEEKVDSNNQPNSNEEANVTANADSTSDINSTLDKSGDSSES
ncbi:MAG: efflux RND transporter periplasmic adaptor subunit [Alphaproteobacteria bacterium]|nr:MAG: efflux RND transporter periplasmic adaptor subunit [Alphaproteobacteria bacterium]